jgi:hypothetical protein
MPSVKERLRTGKVPLAGFLNLIPSLGRARQLS